MRCTLFLGLVLAASLASAAPALAAPPPTDPMAYADVDDLTDRYGTETIAQLTGDATGATVNEEKANEAIDAASSEIEIAVVTQYGESLVEREIEYLKHLARDGAYLMLKVWSPTESGEADSAARLNLERWDAKLDKIAAGKVKLLADAELAGDTDGDGEPDDRPTFRASPRLFGREGNPALAA